MSASHKFRPRIAVVLEGDPQIVVREPYGSKLVSRDNSQDSCYLVRGVREVLVYRRGRETLYFYTNRKLYRELLRIIVRD